MKLPFVLLASNSPRRKELIQQLGFDFKVVPNFLEETYPEDLNRKKVPVFLAKNKNLSSTTSIKEGQILLTADTIVLSSKILEKPINQTNAVEMISSLSGKTHEVITGVCIRNINKTIAFDVTTKVTFGQLSTDEIEFYVKTFKPYDKAGSYGIQEWIGLIGIEKIEGSYPNVVGLPTKELYDVIKKEFI